MNKAIMTFRISCTGAILLAPIMACASTADVQAITEYVHQVASAEARFSADDRRLESDIKTFSDNQTVENAEILYNQKNTTIDAVNALQNIHTPFLVSAAAQSYLDKSAGLNHEYAALRAKILYQYLSKRVSSTEYNLTAPAEMHQCAEDTENSLADLGVALHIEGQSNEQAISTLESATR